MIEIPAAYVGREQTFVKHRVLAEYLYSWGMKLGSNARFRDTRLWYVDCFSGPWEHQTESFEDTSIAIGLKALTAALNRWGDTLVLRANAVFIEKGRDAHAALLRAVEPYRERISITCIHGEFGESVAQLDRMIRDDPAFLLVDPKGWKGADMAFLAHLLRTPCRDVMVNVMVEHISRFKDAPHDFLRGQMRDFFGLDEQDLPRGLSEEELMRLYRQRLRDSAGISVCGDLAVQHPTSERTKFRLVVGGHHQAVIELFRAVEAKVCGREAVDVKTAVDVRKSVDQGRQFTLLGDLDAGRVVAYTRENDASRELLPELAVDYLVSKDGPVLYGDLLLRLLQELHMTKTEIGQAVYALAGKDVFRIENWGGRERSMKPGHILILGPAAPRRPV